MCHPVIINTVSFDGNGNPIEQMLGNNVPLLVDNGNHSISHMPSQSRPAFHVLFVGNRSYAPVSLGPTARDSSVGDHSPSITATNLVAAPLADPAPNVKI